MLSEYLKEYGNILCILRISYNLSQAFFFSPIKILTDSCFLLFPSSFQIFCFMVHLEQERPPLFLLLPESFTGKSAQPFFILVVINFHHLAEFPLLHNKLRISEGEWKHVLPSDWEASTDVFILLM